MASLPFSNAAILPEGAPLRTKKRGQRMFEDLREGTDIRELEAIPPAFR
jgi:hypothetical protein